MLYDGLRVKRFLIELERAMAAATPEARARVSGAYRSLIRGVVGCTDEIGREFKPTGRAAIGLVGDLLAAMTKTNGGAALLLNLRKLAPTIGPHVAALVSTL